MNVVVSDWLDGRDQRQLSDFMGHAGFSFALRAADGVVVPIDEHNYGGTVSTGDGAFQAFLVQLDEAQFAALSPGVSYDFVPADLDRDHTWLIAEDVKLAPAPLREP